MEHWSRRGALAWLLWPASLVFAVAVSLRKVFLKLGSEHPGIPVIVVGNISVGGTGKTPLVLWIAEFLKAKGWKPGIVSRGYGGTVEQTRAAPCAASIASRPEDTGDEPIVLARRSGCPVWVGADRVAAARALRAAHPEVDVLVLDDGLQHYRLRRDIEIALVDSRGFGNGFLLPAGPLREPVSRLRSVDAVVAHGGAGEVTMQLEGDVLYCMANAADRRHAQSFAGAPLHAVAGIGDPERFFAALERFGLQVVRHPFPDHHRFAPEELDFGDERPVLMTEKDAVKLRHAARPNWWVLPVTARLSPAFGGWLLGRLDEWRRSQAA